jgi:hypothetical protein
VLPYRLRVHVLRADAAYLNSAFLDIIRNRLHVAVNVDCNLRCQGKPLLTDTFILRKWCDLMTHAPTSNVTLPGRRQRRYLGLKYFRVQGYLAINQFVFRI